MKTPGSSLYDARKSGLVHLLANSAQVCRWCSLWRWKVPETRAEGSYTWALPSWFSGMWRLSTALRDTCVGFGGGGLVAKSCLTLMTPWTVACQAPLSVGFSSQEYWSGLPFPPPADLPEPGIEPMSLASPALAGVFFSSWAIREAQHSILDTRDKSNFIVLNPLWFGIYLLEKFKVFLRKYRCHLILIQSGKQNIC